MKNYKVGKSKKNIKRKKILGTLMQNTLNNSHKGLFKVENMSSVWVKEYLGKYY